jgi:hypothetical protein
MRLSWAGLSGADALGFTGHAFQTSKLNLQVFALRRVSLGFNFLSIIPMSSDRHTTSGSGSPNSSFGARAQHRTGIPFFLGLSAKKLVTDLLPCDLPVMIFVKKSCLDASLLGTEVLD